MPFHSVHIGIVWPRNCDWEEIQNFDRRVATPPFDRINSNVIQLFNAVRRIYAKLLVIRRPGKSELAPPHPASIGGTKDLEFGWVSLDEIQETIEAGSVKLDTIPRRTNEAGGLFIHQFHWMVHAGILYIMEAKIKDYHSTLVLSGCNLSQFPFECRQSVLDPRMELAQKCNVCRTSRFHINFQYFR
jgi:hypothetical protein